MSETPPRAPCSRRLDAPGSTPPARRPRLDAPRLDALRLDALRLDALRLLLSSRTPIRDLTRRSLDAMPERSTYTVYILANVKRSVLYVGVTNDLPRRIREHRAGEGGAFTRRYRTHTLVYAEDHADVRDAIQREKKLKGGRREWKESLIRGLNPTMRDLWGEDTRPW